MTRIRLDALTSLRFFAAAFVVVHHAFGPDNKAVLGLGYLGVTFFFVLSGFVLAWSTADRVGLGAFYRNRVARIYPLHVATLVVAAVLPFSSTETMTTLLQNLTMTHAWTNSGAHSFNSVSWSISVEALFYALFPLLARWLRRLTSGAVLAVAVAAGAVQVFVALSLRALDVPHAGFLTYDFPPYRVPEFVIGICAALLVMRGESLSPVRLRALYAFAAVDATIIVASSFVRDLPRELVSSAFIPVVVTLIWAVVAAEQAGGVAWLRSRPLLKLGEWSFALYLVHMLVIRPISDQLGQPIPGYLPLGWGLVACALALILSTMFSEGIEKPLERLMRAPRTTDAPVVAADPM